MKVMTKIIFIINIFFFLSFENEGTNDQNIKANFVTNLWAWANGFMEDKTNSVVEFITWLGST